MHKALDIISSIKKKATSLLFPLVLLSPALPVIQSDLRFLGSSDLFALVSQEVGITDIHHWAQL
jgi:hypothetical protein